MSTLLRVLAALFVSLSVAASVAASAKDAASGQFEILTLSNRADLISGGDALVEVRVPQTVPLHQVTLWLNGLDVTATFRTDTAARTMRGVLTGLEEGQNEFLADSNGRGHGRPRASLAITNHPIGGPVLLGSQTTPWICATPTPTRAIGQHAGDERERPVDLRDRRAMQYRDRVQALLPDDDRRLLERAAGSEPAGRAADQQLLQAVHAGQRAGRSCHDHDDRRIDGAVHRARGARNDKSRHLRHRGSVRPQQAVVGALAAGAVERQGRLQLRRVDGPAAAAIPHGTELGRQRGAVARLHGGRQQPHRFALQLEPRPERRDADDDEGAHRRHLRRDHVHARQRLLGRLDPAEHRRVDLSRTARRHPAELATTPTRSPPASRSRIASCWSTSTQARNGRR